MTFSTLNQLVAGFAEHTERRAILAFRGKQAVGISYGQLADSIHRVARGLRARHIGDGHLVALWAPNSPQWVIAYFGVVCSGAAVIVLDNQTMPEIIEAVLGHAQPKLMLTTTGHAEELRARGIGQQTALWLIDADPSVAESWQHLDAAESVGLPETQPDQLASLLYTSGTTGTPKAVPLTHGNLSTNASALITAPLIGPDDRVLVPLPLHHTYPFTVGLLTTLGTGATIVLPSGISGPEISRAAQTTGATVLLAVPRLCAALWDGLISEVRSRGPFATRLFLSLLQVSILARRTIGLRLGRRLFRAVHARLGGRLELIGCGGAKLDDELIWNLEGLGWHVLTGYGLTETSPVLTFNDREHCRTGSEGRALGGVELRIESKPGETQGEILARGSSVFGGYWNNPSATRATFTDDGWFRTGDLGWLDSDGYLYVVGRSKELIVLPDGKNVFPDELEKVYAASPLLREVAVLEVDGALVALTVPNEQAMRQRGTLRASVIIREVLEQLAGSLPPYQRVTDYRITREPLPRTQLGKLKRHLLPALYRDAANHGREEAASPPTDEDRRLLGSSRGQAAWEWLKARYPDRQLTLDSSPQLDLQVDSLEWVAITTEIERRFRIALTGDAVSRVLTLRDLLREIDVAEMVTEQIPPSERPTYQRPGVVLRAAGAVIQAAVRIFVRLAFRIETDGTNRLPASGPFLITPNHTSYLDPLALITALPWRQLRRTYWAGWAVLLYRNPMRRLVSRAAQVFPIDPDRDLAAAIDTARALLQEGYSVVWFPEGRRSGTGELQPFQRGVGSLLDATGVPAVPTAIRGAFEAWPRHQRWPHLQRLELRVTFGEPLKFARTANAHDGEKICGILEQSVRGLVEHPRAADGLQTGSSHDDKRD